MKVYWMSIWHAKLSSFDYSEAKQDLNIMGLLITTLVAMFYNC